MAFRFIAYAVSAAYVSAFAEVADFKKITIEKYGELKDALAANSNHDSLKRLIDKNFDVPYISSRACCGKLSSAQAHKLDEPVKRFMCHLFDGEAMRKVSESTMDDKSVSVIAKNTTVFVNSKLSDGTECTVVFLKDTSKIIDIRCVGISLAKVLDTIISKYCERKQINFKSKKLAERITIVIQAIDWHINGQV
jgi:hypothetical protein